MTVHGTLRSLCDSTRLCCKWTSAFRCITKPSQSSVAGVTVKIKAHPYATFINPFKGCKIKWPLVDYTSSSICFRLFQIMVTCHENNIETALKSKSTMNLSLYIIAAKSINRYHLQFSTNVKPTKKHQSSTSTGTSEVQNELQHFHKHMV